MLNEDSIKTIILNAKNSNNIELNDAILVIKAFIFEKKKINLDNKEIEISPFDVNNVINAFQYASQYFEKKLGIKMLYKKHQPNETQPILIYAWF